jgi:large subunit ribosomal protein L31
MKSSIHPQWHHNAVVTCSCGNTFETGSTQNELSVDICSACHPFFTGEMKFIDEQGRVDKFLAKQKKAQKLQQQQQSQSGSKKGDDQGDQKSYQEILREQRSKLRKQKKAA